MFIEVELKRGDRTKKPLKCFLHVSLMELVNDEVELNAIPVDVFAVLMGEPNIDGAVVNLDCGPILIRDHDNGGLSFYAAIRPRHQGLFAEASKRTDLDYMMLEHGFIPCPPVIDAGIDCIYYREVDNEIRLIQQKQRVGIWKKYQNRNIWVAFPDEHEWFIYPHDMLVELCETADKWVNTESWLNDGHYHAANVPEWMWSWMVQWKLGI